MKNVLSGLVIAALLGLVACQNNTPADPVQSHNITYFQDERTHICFAAVNSLVEGYNSTSIATVPCEQVKGFLQK
jgi:hypothetical protein